MPEGPETRRSADQLAGALKGRRAQEVFFAHDRLKPFEAALAGRKVTGVTSRGKAMLIRFDGGWTVYSHNQLYGRWYVGCAGERPSTGRQLRLAIHNRRQSAFLYSASDIDVLDADALAAHPFLARLGPDLLDRRLGVDAIVRRLDDTRFRKRGLAGLLLDQGFVAGTGNYLRSEILFVAGVAPRRKPADLNPTERTAVASAALDTTRQAYRTGGITNAPDIVARMKRDGSSANACRHYVFGRDDQPCHRCGTRVVRASFGGRRLYWCPTCQR